MNEENKYIYVSYWLLLITFLVALMIIVGGLTRLTDSGLSITKWNLISGIFPPLSLRDWEQTFSLYKEIPEYKLLNSSMTLEQFKTIFYWEYIHRLLGRIIGIVYIFPLIFFTIKRKIDKKKLLFFYLIFFLICFQGFLGWFMVKSGLTEKTDVSHYRLSIHLTLAFIILILLFWNYLGFRYKNYLLSKNRLPLKLPLIFIFLVMLQISFGALVSGLDAGLIYQSWPLMNQNYFPDDSVLKDLLTLKSLNEPSIVQFVHRNLAYFIVFIFLIMFFETFKKHNFIHLRKSVLIIFVVLLFQVFLGILTILSGAQIFLASMHQIGSIFLILASINLLYKNYRVN